MSRALYIVFFALALLPACTTMQDGSKAKDFLAQPLKGHINGKEWKYKYAYIDPSIKTPGEDDYVFVFLPYVPTKPCPKEGELGSAGDSRLAMVAASTNNNKTIKLKRGGKRTLVFHFDRKSEQVALSAKQGKLKLTNIGGRTIEGQLLAQVNQDNWLNGSFKAVVCQLAEMRNVRLLYD